jgi:23S rRNA U2552 (ribose-2'-O)-methylase RlmE/FtsJ
MSASPFAVEHPLYRSPSTSASTASPWTDALHAGEASRDAQRLHDTKRRVRVHIDTHGDAAWRSAVHQPTPPWPGARPRPASRAYFKMWELAQACALPRPSTSVHLCEAPGGFVQACVDLYPGLAWRATTLASGPRFSADVASLARASPPSSSSSPSAASWSGVVQHASGDLLDPLARDEMAEALGCADLITADGAAPMDHDDLERSALPLARAQAEVALRLCNVGGSVVLKLFEVLLPETRRLVARLCHGFGHCSLYKPTHSRPTNSEVYLVCVDRLEQPPSADDELSWLPSLHDATLHLARRQVEALHRALSAHEYMLGGGAASFAAPRARKTSLTKASSTTRSHRRGPPQHARRRFVPLPRPAFSSASIPSSASASSSVSSSPSSSASLPPSSTRDPTSSGAQPS